MAITPTQSLLTALSSIGTTDGVRPRLAPEAVRPPVAPAAKPPVAASPAQAPDPARPLPRGSIVNIVV